LPADPVGRWSNVFEHGWLYYRMKVQLPPYHRLPMAVNTEGFIARGPQKTGSGIPLDLPAGARLAGAVIPRVEGMAGRERQVADMTNH